MKIYPFCKNGKHCHDCRNHEPTRKGFAASLNLAENFICPRGLSIGTAVSAAAPLETAPEAACKFRGMLLQKSACRCGAGAVWECFHPSMMQPDGNMAVGHRPGRQIGKACGKEKCRGYVPLPSN